MTVTHPISYAHSNIQDVTSQDEEREDRYQHIERLADI